MGWLARSTSVVVATLREVSQVSHLQAHRATAEWVVVQARAARGCVRTGPRQQTAIAAVDVRHRDVSVVQQLGDVRKPPSKVTTERGGLCVQVVLWCGRDPHRICDNQNQHYAQTKVQNFINLH